MERKQNIKIWIHIKNEGNSWILWKIFWDNKLEIIQGIKIERFVQKNIIAVRERYSNWK